MIPLLYLFLARSDRRRKMSDDLTEGPLFSSPPHTHGRILMSVCHDLRVRFYRFGGHVYLVPFSFPRFISYTSISSAHLPDRINDCNAVI